MLSRQKTTAVVPAIQIVIFLLFKIRKNISSKNLLDLCLMYQPKTLLYSVKDYEL